jgi:DNA-directed RNA polymerase specialized sigma24 family protein
VKSVSLDGIELEELLQRLTLYAYTLFGCFPDVSFEPILRVHGASPGDLAIETITKFLDPDDHTVEWKRPGEQQTMEGLLAYLRTVLFHDFIDLKREGMYKATTCLPAHGGGDTDEQELTLDDFASRYESPEAALLRKESRDRLLERLNDEPELHELLTVQLDPDGYNAYTNIELATLLNTSVAEIENRKKKLANRLLRFQGEAERSAKRGK